MTVLNILNDNIDWGIDEQKEWANALQVKKMLVKCGLTHYTK